LDVIGQKSEEFSSLLFRVISTKGFSPPPPSPIKSGLKLVCNANIEYGNLKSENYPEYAQKPQRHCTFMNSASGQHRERRIEPLPACASDFSTFDAACQPQGAAPPPLVLTSRRRNNKYGLKKENNR
jgi:hypothetical protein